MLLYLYTFTAKQLASMVIKLLHTLLSCSLLYSQLASVLFFIFYCYFRNNFLTTIVYEAKLEHNHGDNGHNESCGMGWVKG